MRLLEAISESLDLERDYINSELGKHAQHMAINYYPPCPEPELTYGLPGHADPNAITILLQDEVPGLQVLKDEKWIAVNPIPYTFIVNIGDQIQVRGLLHIWEVLKFPTAPLINYQFLFMLNWSSLLPNLVQYSHKA